jgi:hypothetical protein
MSGHRVVLPASTKLNKTEIKAFAIKTNRLFAALRKIGIVCRKNFTCCGTCGHAEMNEKYPGKDYVFFHSQMADDLRRGFDELYLHYEISDANFTAVAEILSKFDSVWGNTVKGVGMPRSYWRTAAIKLWYHPMTEADRCGELDDHIRRAWGQIQAKIERDAKAAAAKEGTDGWTPS